MKPIALRCLCPCGAGRNYAACCARFHVGPLHLQAPTAEALMRSRYSAHVLELGGYLLDTWHASTRPADVPTFDPALRWLGLEVRRHAMLADGSAVIKLELLGEIPTDPSVRECVLKRKLLLELLPGSAAAQAVAAIAARLQKG